MHPIASYELARIRIDQLHEEAARERLAASARAGRPAADTRAIQHVSFAQPLGLLRRLLARLSPAPVAG